MNIARLLDQLPPGLDRAILRVLSYHTGRENAVARPALLEEIARLGFRVDDRAMRAAINQLRKGGHLICSAGGENGGYYLARDWEELKEFIEREMHARAMDLLEQEKALRAAASNQWGPESHQISLGI